MGYTHGKQWTEQEVIYHIKEVMKVLNIQRMPTRNEIKGVMKNDTLTNKISRSGGYKYWANKLELPLKQSETKLGNEYELAIQELLKNKGYEVEKMSTKHPYDLLINNNIKVDVKVSNWNKYKYYTFNLEKTKHNCDIFICIALREDEIEKMMIIPSKYLMGIKQLSVGKESKYDLFVNRFDYLEKYDFFYKDL